MITYPRRCPDCKAIYKYKSNYSQHKTKGVCHRKCEKEANLSEQEIELNQVPPTIQQIQNNIQTQNNNINIQNNITIKQDFSDLMSTPFIQHCTLKEKKQILEVLEILGNKGYKTAQDVQDFIMKEYKTIQHFEQQIKRYSISCMRDIAGNNKPKNYAQKNDRAYKDEWINKCIVTFFNILICKDEIAITPEVLASNPLFKSSGGSLKAWSLGDVVECDEGRKQFGMSSTMKGATMRQWTPMQDEATWKQLVDVIGNSFIEALNSEKYNGGYSPLEYEELATYWQKKLDEDERPAVIDELCAELANICRQDHTKGWYNLTNMLAKKQKYLDTTNSEPTLIQERMKTY